MEGAATVTQQCQMYQEVRTLAQKAMENVAAILATINSKEEAQRKHSRGVEEGESRLDSGY